MDRDRSIKSAWDVFGSAPPSRAAHTSATSSRLTSSSKQPAPVGDQRFHSSNGVEKAAGSDSAVSASSDEDEREICRIFDYLNDEEKRGRHRRAAGKDRPGELQHIEQHLSMKKTLRKKMMRDLKQAFVEDPNEFRQDHNLLLGDQRHVINLHNMHLSGEKSGAHNNFLTMLKDDPDSGHGSPTMEAALHPRQLKEKKSFWKRLTGGGKKGK